MLRLACVLVPTLLAVGCRAGEEAELAAGDPARGFARVRERGCTSCHASAEVAAEPAPRLEAVGARLTPRALGAALAGGPRMPDCLAGLAQRERAGAESALTHHLASLGGPLERGTVALDALALERGRQLYHSVGCVACHAPFEAAETLAQPLWEYPEAFERAPAPPATADARSAGSARDPLSLTGLGERTALAPLARYLADPLAVHPAGRMPSLALASREAFDLAAYLLYEDAVDDGAVLASRPGLALDYHEADFAGETADFDALDPVRSETATSFFEGIARREDDFGLRFRGLIAIETAGLYRFSTRSDDGSMLHVDGKVVVDNHGQHASDEKSGEIYLAAGRHALEVTYFEHLGGDELEVRWSGPGFEERPLGFDVLARLSVELPAPVEPFAVDPALAERGRALYATLGCASCHDGGPAQAAPLAELDPRRGCLAEEPKGRAPCYFFAPGERADLVAALRARTPPPRTASERLAAELARLDCVACHERDGLGGPDDARRSYFQVADGLDLGDEGRLPPSLDRAGAKLKPAWFGAILVEGVRARPYMRTRMPRFGLENVAALPALFAEVDSSLRDEREPAFSVEAVAAGKHLAGTKGLGCIQCHDFAGHPSIGIPAVDLARVHERIHPGWFRELLMDPVALKMNTRMPSFWVDGRSPVKGVLDGDPARQVDALWTYLSLGSSMPLPEGLVPLAGEYEVEVYDRPVCVGVFMEGVSPRTVAVGLPERVHYAFDVQNSRLAKAWRGRFLDARGTWHARAGQLEKPAGEDVLEFPRLPTIALLENELDPWPTASAYRVRGRGLDAERRPVFRYELGHVLVDESVVPEVRPGGAALVRRLGLFGDEIVGACVLLAVGRQIDRVDEEVWVVSGSQEFRVQASKHAAFVVPSGDGFELRARVRRTGTSMRLVGDTLRCADSDSLKVTYSW